MSFTPCPKLLVKGTDGFIKSFKKPDVFSFAVDYFTNSPLVCRLKVTNTLYARCTSLSDSTIIGLFFWCSPLTVLRRIVTINVNSFYGMVCTRSLSHIVKKVLERIDPPITDSYSSTPIVCVAFVRRIFTSITHVYPNSVSRVLSLKSIKSRMFATVPKKTSIVHQAPASLDVMDRLIAVFNYTIHVFILPQRNESCNGRCYV